MIFYELKDIELMVSCMHIVYLSSPSICPTIGLSTCPWAESAFLLLKQKVSEYDHTYIHTCIHLQGSHRLEKYLNIQDCLEKSLKIKFALKSTEKHSKAMKSP